MVSHDFPMVFPWFSADFPMNLPDFQVHRETMQRVSAAFRAKRMSLVGKVSVEQLGKLLDYVMMSYILEVRMKFRHEMQI